MPNYNPPLENLKPFKQKWQSGKTQTIRVPKAIAPLVLEAAKDIDTNGNVSLSQVNKECLKAIEDLKQQNEYLLDELNKKTAKTQKNKSSSISVTSESFDRKQVFKIISKCLSARRSGEIKELLSNLGNLLGFQVERGAKNKWVIYDISD